MTSDRRPTEDRTPRSAASATATTTAPAGDGDLGAVRTTPEGPAAEGMAAEGMAAGDTGRRGRRRRARATGGDDGGAAHGDDRGRVSFRLVPVLLVLLVLLLAGVGYLWFTRPATSSVTTADYVQALQAARSGVVDLTSFDYLTLDDDIRQIERITTGDLKKEAVAQLDGNRDAITKAEATVHTEIVAAAVTAADADHATVLLVIQSTQDNKESRQAQVTKYRIEATLEKVGERWLLSGIAGR